MGDEDAAAYVQQALAAHAAAARKVLSNINTTMLARTNAFIAAADPAAAHDQQIAAALAIIDMTKGSDSDGMDVDSFNSDAIIGGDFTAGSNDQLNAMALRPSGKPISARALQTGVEVAMRKLKSAGNAATAQGNHKAACSYIMQFHELREKYLREYQPLVQYLGHDKAVELFQAKNSLIDNISEQQWQFLTAMMRDGKFKEAVTSMGLAQQEQQQQQHQKQQQQQQDKQPSRKAKRDRAEGEDGDDAVDRHVPHCCFCGGGHYQQQCRSYKAFMAAIKQAAAGNHGQPPAGGQGGARRQARFEGRGGGRGGRGARDQREQEES
jgi:hypothetical protein